MRIFTVLVTFFVGVLIEYFLIIKPFQMSGEFLDYLFLLGILVVPGLFIFILPISILINSFGNIHFFKLFIIYLLLGIVLSVITIIMAIPVRLMNIFLQSKILFVVLNGAWFSLFYLFVTEFSKRIKVKRKSYSEN